MNSWTVGRSNECDIVLAMPTVSRRHAKMSGSGPDLDIEDVGSTTGTFIKQDGEWAQVMRATISCDAPLRLGDHVTTARALLSAAGIDLDDAPATKYDGPPTQPRRES